VTAWATFPLINGDLRSRPRQRGSFLTEAAEEKLIRYRQIAAIKAAAGARKDKDDPELKWVAKMRRQDERRFKKVAKR
jgi:hypothetical protein